MVYILPEAKAGEYAVSPINHPIAVAAILSLIIFSQGDKAIGVRGLRLWSKIAEQFCPTVYLTISIAIQRQPCVVSAGSSPGKPPSGAITVEVEGHSVRIIREIEAIAQNINQHWRAGITIHRAAGIVFRA